MFWSTVEADKKGQTLENKVNARTFSQRAQGVAGKDQQQQSFVFLTFTAFRGQN